MKTIIVPTDFSDVSFNAAVYAVEMALHLHSDIVLLHILSLPVTVSEVPLPLESYEICMEEANRSLEEWKEKLGSNREINIRCLATTENFAEQIQSFDGGKGPFAVIMGASGSGAAETLLFGSFCLTAIKHLRCPVFVIPSGYTYKIIEKVGLACDMDNVLDHIPIKGIRAIFEHFDAQLEVLYVNKPSEKMTPEVLRESKFIKICLVGYRPEIRILSDENVQNGLEGFVRHNHIDLLLLLPKERGFMEALFHKSVTREMALHPGIPVMIVHG